MTRGAVAAEGVEGGFSATYRILSAFEESGQARRGYVVEGLGAAQFAMDGAVDRLRAVANARDRGDGLPDPAFGYGAGFPAGSGTFDNGTTGSSEGFFSPAEALGPFDDHAYRDDEAFDTPDGDTPLAHPAPGEYASPRDHADAAPQAPTWQNGGRTPAPPWQNGGRAPGSPARPDRRAPASRAVVLAAADPANAYGAALPWPEPPAAPPQAGPQGGFPDRPGRRRAALYMERGGKTLLAWPATPDGGPTDDPRLGPAAEALAEAARAGALGTVTVERINGAAALTSPVGTLLEAAGFVATPQRPAPAGVSHDGHLGAEPRTPGPRERATLNACPKETRSGNPRGACTPPSPARS
ncbi:hypothetical protein GCM10020295_21550 [Streptomyces cinereospinus]